ncbi:hypothetical protein [Clostridium culturomicium]|uniref:hypothetical protein n=1 Tax=Clostridium culturomicium TaxID=1499683 RepID=UPI003857E2F2
MKNKIKVFIRVICFIILLSFMLFKVNEVLMRKSITGEWNMTIKTNGFYNEAENRFDVMGFGSSHMYCTVNPLTIWENTGIPSYLLTSQQQPPCTTYYYIKEALKTQAPKVVLVEAYMFTLQPASYDEGVFHDAVDFLRPSKNKRDLINEMIPENERINYHIPLLKYHTRWEELEEQDFDNSYRKMKDWLKGYVFLKDSKEISVDEEVFNEDIRLPIPEENLKYLDKIIELSEEENFKLVLIASPYNVSAKEHGVFNSISDYAEEKGIDFINFNSLFNELNLNTNTDFYDSGHTNVYGAEKVSNYLGEYLQKKYELENYSEDENYTDFNEGLEKFNKEK